MPLFEPKHWNLWIDDIRDPEMFLRYNVRRVDGIDYREYMFSEFSVYSNKRYIASDFIWAKTAADAIRLVKAFGPPQFMALDHDLGDHTVFDFLKWLADTHIDVPPDWHAHSANPEGVKNINAFMKSWHKIHG